MLLRSLVVVGLVGITSFMVNVAVAEEAVAPTRAYAIDGVSFVDAGAQPTDEGPQLDFGLIESFGSRFANLGPGGRSVRDDDTTQYEVALTASRAAGLPVDVSLAQRGSFAANAQGDIERRSRGSELRLGRGLSHSRRALPSFFDPPSVYLFAASDDEAITWRPGSSSGGQSPGFALQDRVEIGDMQAGLTYEAGPFQASLAYVKRKVSARTAGVGTVSHDESFTGVTLTMRH